MQNEKSCEKIDEIGSTKQNTLDRRFIVDSGALHAYFIFDLADTIDLTMLLAAEGSEFAKAPLDLRPQASSGFIQFNLPPLMAKLADVIVGECRAETRLKIYDYGTLVLRVSFPLNGEVSDIIQWTNKMRQSEVLFAEAEKLLADNLKHVSRALNKPHSPVQEDYFVIEINKTTPAMPAKVLLDDFKKELSLLIMGESALLSESELDEALKVNFSYFETDLAILQWDASIVVDTREAAEAVESIIEFANTQLVELYTYDKRLDVELDEIYKWDVTRMKPHWLFGRREAAKRTGQLRNILVDIRELSDRGNNALKIIGDAFYARLYRGIASRLGLSVWQQQLESKLDSVAEVYQFANDQAQHLRSEFLEMIIIALILIEIVLSILPGRHG